LLDSKDLIASAIAKAQTDLEDALSELAKMPAFDAGSVAVAAHKLNNYLSVSAGILELALLRLGDHADPKVRNGLEGAQHVTQLMARIVAELVRGQATPETAYRFMKFDLLTLVQSACSYYQRVADRKDIRVITGPSVDVPPVWSDRAPVAAVLDNLLSNAVKYSPPGTEIRIDVRGEEGWAVCSVKDEGPGLSLEDQAKLFQRGTRLAPTPTGGESSMGYGLAVAKGLLDGLGGTIWCESELGRGCYFSFRLPTYPEQANGTEPEVRRAQRSGEPDRTNRT
jgi:signal transduction histidine kinase